MSAKHLHASQPRQSLAPGSPIPSPEQLCVGDLCVLVCVCACHVCMYVCPHIHTSMHTYIHPCLHTYIHEYVHTYIHTYMPAYIPLRDDKGGRDRGETESNARRSRRHKLSRREPFGSAASVTVRPNALFWLLPYALTHCSERTVLAATDAPTHCAGLIRSKLSARARARKPYLL